MNKLTKARETDNVETTDNEKQGTGKRVKYPSKKSAQLLKRGGQDNDSDSDMSMADVAPALTAKGECVL